MKGRFQPTTVGNMVRDANGGYVCYFDYEEQAVLLRECRAALDDLLSKQPAMAGLRCGSTTLGNLRAELNSYKRSETSDDDFAAIVKRYEDAGDHANAEIIRRQWEVARGNKTTPNCEVSGAEPLVGEASVPPRS